MNSTPVIEKVKVSELIAQALEDLGIRHIFGIIGAGNVHLFEAISKRGYTEIVCVHHEQAACMAMQTYYRTCGKLAASLLTTGAGSTNGVTGVVSAWADTIPCLVIAGNENSKFNTVPIKQLRQDDLFPSVAFTQNCLGVSQTCSLEQTVEKTWNWFSAEH